MELRLHDIFKCNGNSESLLYNKYLKKQNITDEEHTKKNKKQNLYKKVGINNWKKQCINNIKNIWFKTWIKYYFCNLTFSLFLLKKIMCNIRLFLYLECIMLTLLKTLLNVIWNKLTF